MSHHFKYFRCGALAISCFAAGLTAPQTVSAADPAAKSASRSDRPRLADQLQLKIGRETTVIDGPLDQDGLPNYLEYLNQTLGAGVANDENYWALAWQALGNVERSSPHYIAAVEERLGIQISPEPRLKSIATMNGATTPDASNKFFDLQAKAAERPWTRDEYPAVAKWLDANAEALALAEQAAARPKAYSPLIASGDLKQSPVLVAVLLPHVQGTRELTRNLTARAMLRLGEGDREGAWNDIVTIYRIARHVERGWTLIEHLVAVAVRTSALNSTAQWLSQPDLTVDDLERRWAELSPLLVTQSFSEAMKTERLMYADCVISLASGRTKLRNLTGLISVTNATPGLSDVLGTERLMENIGDAVQHMMLSAADVNQTLKFGNGVYDELVAALEPADHQTRAARIQAIDARFKADADTSSDAGALLVDYLLAPKSELETLPGRMLTRMLTPAITQCEAAQAREEGRMAALRAAFRMRIALSKNPDAPASWETLASDAEANSLKDPFTGEPLKIVEDERGLVIWSVGANGKDDQGKTFGDGEGMDDLRAILTLP
jgi:hypothetical protein